MRRYYGGNVAVLKNNNKNKKPCGFKIQADIFKTR